MKVVAFLQPGMADWEAGTVLAYLREEFGAEVLIATPDARHVTSIGGLRVAGDLAFADVDLLDRPILLLIGSEVWAAFDDEDFFAMLRKAKADGLVIGAICAGTIAAARAGLLDDHVHTSNGLDWLKGHVPDYAGAALYRDAPWAIRDGNLVTAPGSAPTTFAAAVCSLAAPDRQGEADAIVALASHEFIGPSSPAMGHA